MDRFLTLQGGYYLLSGIWPIAHMPSFEAVSGPKHDKWLVKTVGGLIAVVGASMLISARRKQRDPATLALAAGSAAALGLVDWVYAGNGTISKIYMIDGLVEIALLLGLLKSLKG